MAAWLANFAHNFFFPFHSAFHPFPTAEPAGPLNRPFQVNLSIFWGVGGGMEEGAN